MIKLLTAGRFRCIFSSDMLERLNEITSCCKRYIRRQLELKRQQGQKICVVEAALLLEDHYQEFCDTIWYIHTDQEIRIRRLMENPGIYQGRNP